MKQAAKITDNTENIDKVEENEQIIKKLTSLVTSLQGQVREQQHQLKQITSSNSWKLTAPLRKLGALSRVIFPLIRKDKYTYVVNGSDSEKGIATLELQNAGKNPAGWLRVYTSASKIFEGSLLLCYDTGTGFSSSQRLWLHAYGENKKKTVIKLPEGIRRFRLESYANNGLLPELVVFEGLGSGQLFSELSAKHIKPSISSPAVLFAKVRKLFALIRRGGLTSLRARFISDDFTSNYAEWINLYDTLTDFDKAQIKKHISKFSYLPKISIILPTYNTPEALFRAVIESVLKQLYTNWELCIADDGSRDEHIRDLIKEYAASDERIKYVFRPESGHISKASNSALELASGEFVALLDHDDEITEHALYFVVNELNKDQNLSFIYSDEDKIDSYGNRSNPYFKSDWNPDLMLSQNYVCHFSVLRKRIVEQIGGFRAGVEGAQDWDLFLRVADQIPESQIKHIPHILYHWRVVEGSTAQSTAFKPYVLENQARVVREHLERNGEKGRIETLHDISHQRVVFEIPEPQPLVSIIMPTKDKLEVLKPCIESILNRTKYKNFEIIVVDNNSEKKETLDYLNSLQIQKKAKVITDKKSFNFSRINNDAVPHAKGSLLAFLNNDLEVINPDWLDELVSMALRDKVGAVGAKLLFPNNLIQHAGVTLGIIGVAGHAFKGRMREDTGYWNWAILPRTVSAVTAACVLIKREVFEKIGGFDQENLAVAFNDIDLCLRIREEGYRIVYNPYAELYHFESASRGYEDTPEKIRRFEGEISYMKKRWGAVLENDPYYNPNLTLLSEDFTYSFPPRIEKPWKKTVI